MRFEIITGKAERDLLGVVSTALDNHRTYKIGRYFWTGTESYDCDYACSETCRATLMERFPLQSTVVTRSGTNVVGLPIEALSGNCTTTTDATVYEFTKAEGPEMLPIVCAACATTMQDHENPTYEWATKAHAPDNDGVLSPVCGSASAIRNPLDDQPITSTLAQFEALDPSVQCWECRSIVS